MRCFLVLIMLSILSAPHWRCVNEWHQSKEQAVKKKVFYNQRNKMCLGGIMHIDAHWEHGEWTSVGSV